MRTTRNRIVIAILINRHSNDPGDDHTRIRTQLQASMNVYLPVNVHIARYHCRADTSLIIMHAIYGVPLWVTGTL